MAFCMSGSVRKSSSSAAELISPTKAFCTLQLNAAWDSLAKDLQGREGEGRRRNALGEEGFLTYAGEGVDDTQGVKETEPLPLYKGNTFFTLLYH